MHHLLLLTPLMLTLQASSMFILLPLYSYPGTSASAWSNVTTAITSNPHVQWQVIVNPASGPGTHDTTACPTDTNYIDALSILNGFANVMTLGYVDTDFTYRAYSAVIQDITTYASWWGCNEPGYNISIDGIFFDQVNYTASSAASKYMQNASEYAYAQVPSDVTPVIFNPGTLAPTQLFGYCDTMIEFENVYSVYNNATTIKTIIPSSYRAQSAILVTNTPETTAPIASLVHTMAYYGIEAVYFTTDKDPAYQTYDLDLLKQIVAAVAAG